jgi:predicted TIM-barrel fold metal-dependent hydrolase
MIIDAHAHIFSKVDGLIGKGTTESAPYGNLLVGGEKLIQLIPPLNVETTHPPEILLKNMDWAGVDKAVLLQGSFYGARNDEVRDACARYPDRFVGAAFLDPWESNARDEFDRLFDEERFPILKMEISLETGLGGLHPDLQLDDPDVDWLWDGLEQRGIVLTLDPGRVGGPSYQTAAMRDIIESHPELTVVLCHLGFPTREIIDRNDLEKQWEDFVSLGRLPNVWFDLSALPHRAEETYPFPTMGTWIRRAIELIGPDKVMWGTDVPGLYTAGTYQQLLSAYQELLSDLTASERSGIFGETALSVYPFQQCLESIP